METTDKKGCGHSVRISQLTKELMVCGKSTINNEIFLCNDCLGGDDNE